MNLDLPEGIIPVQPSGQLWKVYLSKTRKDFNLATKILEENNYVRSNVRRRTIDFVHTGANVYGPIKNISLDKSWLWAPLEPGKETYEKILSIIGLISDKDWYARDIVTQHIPDMINIIEHFTTIDASTIKLDPKRGLDVLDDLAIQTGRLNGAYKSNNEVHRFLELNKEFAKRYK